MAVTLAFTTAASVSSFPFLRSFPAFLATAVTYAVAQTGLSAARQALLAGIVGPPQWTQVRAFLQAVLNAGLAIGASAGGLALYVNTRAAYFAVFTLEAVAFVAAGFILSRLPTVEAANTEPTLGVLRDKPYAVITALNAVMMLYMPLLSVAIPLWIVLRTPAPGWMVSSLLILNTLSVMLFQVRVARKVTGPRRAAILVQRSGAVMLISCGVFALTAFSGSAWKAATLLVLAATLQVVGEVMLAAGAWEISFNLSAPDKHGNTRHSLVPERPSPGWPDRCSSSAS